MEKCYYELLEVDPKVNLQDLKKAYKKLALEWHPDKNLERLEEATKHFKLVRQAYEVLSDPHERAWYDRHKDEILRKGGDFEDDQINVFNYFNCSCFSGFEDDEMGFYTVYRNVFETIAKEDSQFREKDSEPPSFGDSNSSFEEVVNTFYDFWMGYCTSLPFTWVCEYEVDSSYSRQDSRAIGKINQKARDKLKKKRNEEIRQLVEYVRKRDKRVKEHKKKMDAKKVENKKKSDEHRQRQMKKREKECTPAKKPEETAKVEMGLKELEEEINTLHGDFDPDDEEEMRNSLYCVACDKDFKSEGAMKNHFNSKKHKENVALLKEMMLQENLDLGLEEETISENESLEEDIDLSELDLSDEELRVKKKDKKKSKKLKVEVLENSDSSSVQESLTIEENKVEDVPVPETNLEPPPEVLTEETPNLEENPIAKPKLKGKKAKDARKQARAANNEAELNETIEAKEVHNICVKCGQEFPTRNKMFDHLKKTGHALPPSDSHASQKPSKKRR